MKECRSLSNPGIPLADIQRIDPVGIERQRMQVSGHRAPRDGRIAPGLPCLPAHQAARGLKDRGDFRQAC